jgi:hypothetical protein
VVDAAHAVHHRIDALLWLLYISPARTEIRRLMILRFRATSLTLVSLVLFVRIASSAEPPQKFYLLGDEKFTTAKGEPIPSLSTALLIEKTLDAAAGTFTERAVQVSPSKKQVIDVTMTLTVKGQNFTIKDNLGTMTGNGTLQGPAWAWTFLSGDYVIAANGMKIHDEDYMADQNNIAYRKTYYSPADGKTVVMYSDASLKSITKETFDILVQALKSSYTIVPSP